MARLKAESRLAAVNRASVVGETASGVLKTEQPALLPRLVRYSDRASRHTSRHGVWKDLGIVGSRRGRRDHREIEACVCQMDKHC